VTNARIALTFDRVADLLDRQGASAFRARAWREAARSIREQSRELGDIFRDHGRVGLEAIPHVGPRLAAAIIELVKTGRCGALERLDGDPVHALASVPGLGPRLAERIHHALGIDSLEDLEMAAHDGRLESVPGFGVRRLALIRSVLAAQLAHRRAAPSHRPSVELLLAIDREYRAAAAAGTLRLIAPRRFNPDKLAWLPIMHVERDGWAFTAMFSNTELAHRLGRTDDWVVIYCHEPHGPEGRATVVTEHRGPLRGLRVVRGREHETTPHEAPAAYAQGAHP
jgi:putative hydrolase